MKTFLIIATMLVASAIAMSLFLFLRMRGSASKEEGKSRPFLLIGLFALSAVLLVGFGYRALPEKNALPACGLVLAWGFDAWIPVVWVARKYFDQPAARAKAGKEKG